MALLRTALLSLTTLVSCEAIPDEIQVQTIANQYDYLGGDSNVCLKSMDGESYGGSITAIYKLKPTRVEIVENPAKGFIDDIRESTKDFGKGVVDDFKDSAKSAVKDLKAETLDKALDDATKVINDTIKQSESIVQEAKDIKVIPDISLLNFDWKYLLYLLPLLAIIIIGKVVAKINGKKKQ